MLKSCQHISNVVTVIRWAIFPNLIDRCRPKMFRISCRLIVLEPGVVRAVVFDCTRETGGTPGTSCGPVSIGDAKVEAAHERSPRNAMIVEQITDVPSDHADLVLFCIRAEVTNWISI